MSPLKNSPLFHVSMGLVISGGATFAFFTLLATSGLKNQDVELISATWFALYTVTAIFFLPLERLVSRGSRSSKTLRKSFESTFHPSNLFFFSIVIPILGLLIWRQDDIYFAKYYWIPLFTLVSFSALCLLHFIRGYLSGRALFREFNLLVSFESALRLLALLFLLFVGTTNSFLVLVLISVPTVISVVLAVLFLKHSAKREDRSSRNEQVSASVSHIQTRDLATLAVAASCNALISNSPPVLESFFNEGRQSSILVTTSITVFLRPLFFLVQAIQIVLLPQYSRVMDGSPVAVFETARKHVRWILFGASMVTVVVTIVGPPIIEFFFHVTASKKDLIFYSVALGYFTLGVPWSAAMVACNKLTALVRASFAGLLGLAVFLPLSAQWSFGGTFGPLAFASLTQFVFLRNAARSALIGPEHAQATTLGKFFGLRG